MAPRRTSIIDALPNELLLHIWAHAPQLSVPAIAGVNKRWRALALSAPSLWTYIRVSPALSLEGLQTLLARSQEFGLTVDVRFQLRNRSEESKHEFYARIEHISILMNCLADSVERFRVFGIKVSEPEDYEWDGPPELLQDERREGVAAAITGPLEDLYAPQLEHLHINVFGKVDYVIFTDGLPRLTHLYIGMDTDPRWVDWDEPQYLRYFLGHAPAVTHLYVGDASCHLDDLIAEENTFCPNLCTLTWAPPWTSSSKDAAVLLNVLGERQGVGKVRINQDVFWELPEDVRALLVEKKEVELFNAEEERRKLRLEWM